MSLIFGVVYPGPPGRDGHDDAAFPFQLNHYTIGPKTACLFRVAASPSLQQISPRHTMERLQDIDPLETREWVDSLEAVLEIEGPDRAHFILEQLVDKA